MDETTPEVATTDYTGLLQAIDSKLQEFLSVLQSVQDNKPTYTDIDLPSGTVRILYQMDMGQLLVGGTLAILTIILTTKWIVSKIWG